MHLTTMRGEAAARSRRRLLAVLTGAALLAAAWAAALGQSPGSSPARAIEPDSAQVLYSSSATVPADDDPAWRITKVPASHDVDVAWYRVPFEPGVRSGVPPSTPHSSWMLYLPYFYGGGQVWLNGVPVASITENSARLRVRWERPHLVLLPANVLKEGTNVLHLRAVSSHQPSGNKLPGLTLGPQEEVQAQFDRRLFVVRTLPLVTVVTGVVVGLFVVFIWLRRRQEVAYGLFGAAALLWGMRTSTFVFDALPVSVWPLWRAFYFASTGGFIVVMSLFTLSLAGWFNRRVAWAMLAYAAAGPVAYLIQGDAAEAWVGRWWVLGLVPIGATVAVVSLATAWRTRSLGSIMIAAAVTLAFLAGIHDYAVAWSAPLLEAVWPRWAGHRLFLLHHGANLLLVVMGALLTARFLRSLQEVEGANARLQEKVAERERELAAGYERIAALQRDQATQEERQRIMQELHDGLGSQLVSTLMRAERGALDTAAMSHALRGAIDEMRVAIEALAGDDGDLRTAFGNFRFRWDARLRDAGLLPRWTVELPDEEMLALAPHDTLQLLRVAQEALTNVLKHAQARQVEVLLQRLPGELKLQVRDDGVGLAEAATGAAPAGEAGRGLGNMRARAARLRARLSVDRRKPVGTQVTLAMPLR